MRISFLPKSRLSIWTAGLGVFTISVFLVLYIFAELLNIITSDIIITIFGATAVVSSIISFFTGIITVIKNKERSVVVFIAIMVGFLVLAFIVGDILGLPDI